ncbi:1,4-dihydroxy-6-naphthoate synthase [bacterium]|nr:1,4-dihydroxy-6-naphthoate synthase [bacterium]
MREISLGFSPCPNDTFIFDALVHNKIEHRYKFKLVIEDVETLNQMALNHQLDITKTSIHAWFHVLDNYRLLSAGGALGKGCGPLLLSRENRIPTSGRIGLPGELTTAALLFKMAVGEGFDFVFMPFDKIIPSILKGDVDAGVIIHESRFTYQQFNLNNLLDLGEWWEGESNILIPLGGIIISNKVSTQDQETIQALIKKSIIFAENNPDSAAHFIKDNAQELDSGIITSHINLYVNRYSKDLGHDGKEAIRQLYRKSSQRGLLPVDSLFREDQLFVS